VGKINFRKSLSKLRRPTGSFAVVDVPTPQFVKVDGRGDPNRRA